MLFAAVLSAAIAAPTQVAVARCNNTVATKLEDQVRSYERQPASASELNDRYVALQLIMSNADQEAIVLHAVCTEEQDAPIQSQLDAVQGWALLLESDLNRTNYATRCPAAEKPVAQAFVGAAWRQVVLAGQTGGAPYSSVATVTAKLKPRAEAIGLTLPTPADATAYWLSQLQGRATDAIAACPK